MGKGDFELENSRNDVSIDMEIYKKDREKNLDSSLESTINESSTIGCENSQNLLLSSTMVKSKSTEKLQDEAGPLEKVKNYMVDHSNYGKKAVILLLVLTNFAYLIYALFYDMSKATTLLVMWILLVAYFIYKILSKHLGQECSNLSCLKVIKSTIEHKRFKYIIFACVFVGLALWILFDTIKRPHQLISLGGYFVFMFLLFCMSKYPRKVIWKPVIGGAIIQLFLGFIVLRTEFGFIVFEWIADRAQLFISYVNAGADFVFGTSMDHYFAFRVLPICIYFSSFISVLYHLGIMQAIINKIAWVMQRVLGTSATESMVAAGNIFVGQTESPLLIRPYLKDLTNSEMHAVMTAGFGTIAGSVLGAYLSFGVEAVSIITACVMAAPCALAVSKLVYPETSVSRFMSLKNLKLPPSTHRNIIEAAFVGASQAIPLVLNIAANLIAFLSLLALINGFLGWYGGLSGHPELNFQLICSYVFIPFSFLMGIEWLDCFKVAELIGTKVFLNEFIAYDDLCSYINNRKNGTIPKFDDDGNIQWISFRSETIVTYALCGFANIGSIGIMLGGLSGLCPEKQSQMVKVVVRALIAGVFVSILNSCVAGFLYTPPPVNCTWIITANEHWNYTSQEDLFSCCNLLSMNNNITTNTSELFTNNVCCSQLNSTSWTFC